MNADLYRLAIFEIKTLKHFETLQNDKSPNTKPQANIILNAWFKPSKTHFGEISHFARSQTEEIEENASHHVLQEVIGVNGFIELSKT